MPRSRSEKAASEAATFAAHHVLDRLGRRMPAAFWQDPFILGFFHTFIPLIAVANGLPEDRTQKTTVVYDRLVGKDAVAVIRRMRVLHATRDAEFIRGSENAVSFVTYRAGQNDDVMTSARQAANKALLTNQLDGRTIDEMIGAAAFDGYFGNEIRRRFPAMVANDIF